MKIRDVTWRSAWPLLLVLLAGALCLIGQSAWAQAPARPSPDEIGTLYLGNGQVMAVMHPRLLTKNARIIQFLCAPTGTRIAYLSEVAGPAGDFATLGVATTRDGDDTTYLRADMPTPSGQVEKGTLIQGLDGWSDDAAYLAFEVNTIDILSVDSPKVDQLQCIDVVHNSVVPVPLPFDQLPPAANGSPQATVLYESLEGAAWGPGSHLLAYGVYAHLDRAGQAACLFLYDADHRTTRMLFALDKGEFRFEGWQDSAHLVYSVGSNHFVYDLAAGKSAPAGAAGIARSAIAPWSPASTDTALETSDKEKLTIAEDDDSLDTPEGGKADVASVWIKRIGGPPKPSTLLLDSFPRDRGRSHAQFLPNNGFDRQDTFHVAYACGGDLKIVDIMPRRATPGEKEANGEKLTCVEEEPTAVSDARQLGLGILMYTQDHNLNFPSGDDFHDSVLSYIKADVLFTTPNGEPFHYNAPADPKLADMADPANTVLGDFDLSCEKIVLKGDGHVVVEQNTPAGP